MRILLLLLGLFPLHLAASPIYQYSFLGEVVGSADAIALLDGIEAGSPFRARLGFQLNPSGCETEVISVCVDAYSQADFGAGWFELPLLGATLLNPTSNPEVISLIFGPSPGLLSGTYGSLVSSSFTATLLGLPMDSLDEWLVGLGLYDFQWGATTDIFQVENFSSGSFDFAFFSPDPAAPGSFVEEDLKVRLTGLVAIPEPGSLGLMLLGLGGFAWRRLHHSRGAT